MCRSEKYFLDIVFVHVHVHLYMYVYVSLFSYKVLPSLHHLCLCLSLTPFFPLSLWDIDTDQAVLPLCSQCGQGFRLLSKLEAAELLLCLDSNNVYFFSMTVYTYVTGYVKTRHIGSARN